MAIINPLFENLNLTIKVKNLPWARLKEEIKHNKFDCYFSLAKFSDRELHLTYTEIPIHITQLAIFYTKPNETNKMNFSDHIIGIQNGIDIDKDIPEKYGISEAKIHRTGSNENLFKMLSLNRVNAVITNKVVGENILKNNYSALAVKQLVIEEYQLPVYLAFHKNTLDVNKVNLALSKLSITK
ncbi:hypothetical protein GCM10011501_20110 [Thalassotalea profundi]|uniref:LysR substrate-binding domain-containing protein n=2 Tax=Thalassotalea profundi TaxID=2036687 RepID=A0ABQ3IQU7_9GAMM|nr:hypothetical protein GCM10011501_20110 [Thalassotalea profundi]